MAWPSGIDIVGQRFDANSERQGDELTITEPPAERGTRPTVAAIGGGQFVVVWQDPNNYSVRGRVVTANGQDNPFVITDDGGQYKGGVASAADGSFEVVWYDDPGADQSARIRAQRFKGGSLSGSAVTVAAVQTLSTEPGPQVCAHQDDGSFVVTWDGYAGIDAQPIEYRQYASDGVALSPTLLATPDLAEPFQQFADTACGVDGAHVLVWWDDSFSPWPLGPFNRGRFYQHIGASDFTVGIVAPQQAEPFSAAILKDGDLVVVWHDCTPDDGCAVFGQRFTPTGPVECPGDCNRDGHVTIDELITAVNIALVEEPPSMKQCLPADVNLDYTVSIDELIQAVNRALGGCS